MSGNLVGADMNTLQSMGTNFSKQAAAVDDLMSNLNSDVSATWWQGAVADQFRSAWESDYQPALRRLAEALTDASTEISNRHMALDQAGNHSEALPTQSAVATWTAAA